MMYEVCVFILIMIMALYVTFYYRDDSDDEYDD